LHFAQVGIVHGGAGACGNGNYPGIYVRVDSPAIYNFISDVIDEKEIEEGNVKKDGVKTRDHTKGKVIGMDFA